MAPRKKPKIVYVEEGHPVETEAVSKPQPKRRYLEPNASSATTEPKSRPTFPKPSLMLTGSLALVALTVFAAFILIPPRVPSRPVEKLPRPQFPNCLGVFPEFDWGHALHALKCTSGALEDGQSLGDLLMTRNVDYRHVIQLTEAAERAGVPPMLPGMNYHLLYAAENLERPVIFVYEPSLSSYVFMNLEGDPLVELHQRRILSRQERQLNVVIQTTLADAMYNRNSGLKLTRGLEAAIKYKVDLFHLEPGDQFQVLYEDTQYEGNINEIGDVLAIGYRQNGVQGWAFSYEDEYGNGFYDEEGRPINSGFLMAPLEYFRISSPYDLKRPDPISKSGVIIPHLGTDYAAPEGTPIMAVGDGIVMSAENKGGNGNYVKIFHSDSIQTQYLHMSRFADGIAPNVEVRQGQVIGYVGSTGRSTGPHVCFRYWKNGIQMDHRKERNFGAGGLRGQSLERFHARRDSLMSMITAI
jgi:murein DD-endopeptidase MepM/ murein hydrolase activator NlpD